VQTNLIRSNPIVFYTINHIIYINNIVTNIIKIAQLLILSYGFS